MAIFVSGSTDSTFTPAPAGVWQAVCCDVVDLGLLKVSWNGEEKVQAKIRLTWQIEELMDDGRPFVVNKRYTKSLNEKANLRKDLESWRGRPFTEDELKAFDLEVLLGANALLNVVQVQRPGGKTYANVVSIMPVRRGTAKMTPVSFTRHKDRDTKGDTHDQHEEADLVTADDIPF